jgi:LemA protein
MAIPLIYKSCLFEEAIDKAIEDYNLRVKRFPGVILAMLFGYNEKPFYKADEGAEKAPKIDFNIK